jgi:hypothetical protein
MGRQGKAITPWVFLWVSVGAGSILLAAASAGTKRTIDLKHGLSGVVGYGTLISQRSLEQTLGHKYGRQAYPVHVTGSVRSWSLRRPFNVPGKGASRSAGTGVAFRSDGREIPLRGPVELDVRPEKGGRLNGVLYLLTEEELDRVDARERAYKRRDITGQVDEFAFTGGRVYIYRGLPPDRSIAAADPKEFVVFKENLDSVLKACDTIGPDFRAEFEKTTEPVAFRIISIADVVPWKKN